MKIVKKITVFDVVLTVILVLLSLLFIYPLWTIFVAAFSEPLDYIKNPLVLFPPKFTFYNFRMLITSASVWLGYRNTLIYVVLGTLMNVCLTFLTAYALSMRELPFKRAINFLLTLTLFFSGGLIPTYLIVKSYGLLDTVWAMVLPGGIATYNLMITRTYLSQQIPGDLIEAAEVDGAGAVRTFAQIVTPLAKPILAVITLFPRLRPLERVVRRDGLSAQPRIVPAAADPARDAHQRTDAGHDGDRGIQHRIALYDHAQLRRYGHRHSAAAARLPVRAEVLRQGR